MIDFNVKDYLRPVLPTGRYTVEVKKAILKTNKDGNRMVNLMLKVISAFRPGSIVFSNYNIYHHKDDVAEMARVKFAQLCDAVGLEDIKNISELEGKIFDAQISEGSYNGNKTNNIDAHYEAVGNYERVPEEHLMGAHINANNDGRLTAPPQLNDDIPF